jgi:arabinan endo-1,5-alpha-L-arabinosidase
VVVGRGARRHRGRGEGNRRSELLSRRRTLATAIVLATMAACGALATVKAEAAVVGCPDPTMLVEHRAPGAVTLMCTGDGFPTRSANSIVGLEGSLPHPAFAPDGWPQWAVGGYWSPDLERVGDSYLLYFSAMRTGDHRHCIGVAISDTPDGGFHDVGQPLVSNEPAGAIDPTLLRARGALYLLYKIDGNAHLDPALIYGRPLDPSGLNAGRRKLLLSSRSRGWEEGVVEGPTAVSKGNRTYLLYSGGIYTGPGYAEGEAIRHGRYERVSAGPVLRAGPYWVGTGGGSIVHDKGRLLLAYNAFPAGERKARRRLYVRPLRLVGKALRPVGRAMRIELLA